MKKLLAIFILFPCLCFGATGKISVNVTAGVEVVEVQPIYMSNITVIGIGTVVMLPTGERTSTGNVSFADEYAAPGRFSLSGSPLATYKVTFGAASTLSNGKNSLTVSDLKTSLVNNIGTIGADGKASFAVGCTVAFPLGCSSGVYSGTYTITASNE